MLRDRKENKCINLFFFVLVKATCFTVTLRLYVSILTASCHCGSSHTQLITLNSYRHMLGMYVMKGWSATIVTSRLHLECYRISETNSVSSVVRSKVCQITADTTNDKCL